MLELTLTWFLAVAIHQTPIQLILKLILLELTLLQLLELTLNSKISLNNFARTNTNNFARTNTKF